MSNRSARGDDCEVIAPGARPCGLAAVAGEHIALMVHHGTAVFDRVDTADSATLENVGP
jgi:hypothetical protein